MADESPTTTPETPAAPDPAQEVARLQQEAATARAEAQAYRQAVEAIQRQQAPAPQGATPGGLHPDLVMHLRQQGFTDEAIAQNAQIILPFLQAAAGPVLNELQRAKAETEFLKAARNKREFKHWDAIEDKIETVREEAARQGRFLSAKEAYAIALANNMDAVTAQRETTAQATAHATDVAAQARMVSPKTALNTDLPKTPTTAREIAALPPEERSKLWDDLADVPIQ